MNKKILIGSIIAVAMLLLMPSIPAIQHKVVKDDIINELPEDFDFENIIELLKSGKLDGIKHYILYNIIISCIFFRMYRADYLLDISRHLEFGVILVIDKPILFLRAVWLCITVWRAYNFFNNLSDILRWNWDIPNPLD